VSCTRTHSFDGCRSAVEALVDAHTPFGEIEDVIDDSERLSEEQKSALWLLAWSSQDPPELRRNVEATLRLVAD